MSDRLVTIRYERRLSGSLAASALATTVNLQGGGAQMDDLAAGAQIDIVQGLTREAVTYVSHVGNAVLVTRAGTPQAFTDGAQIYVLNNYQLPTPTTGRIALISDIEAAVDDLEDAIEDVESTISILETGFTGGIYPTGQQDATFVGLEQTLTGSTVSAAPSNGNHLLSLPKLNRQSAGSVNSQAGVTQNTATFWRGDAANRGGFTITAYFGQDSSDLVLGTRRAIGMADGTYGTNLLVLNNPSDRDNVLLFGWDDDIDPANSNYYFIRNDTGTAVRVDTGVDIVAGNVYQVTWHCDANGAAYAVTLQNLTTPGVVFSQSFTTSIPANTVFMTFNCFMHNGSSAVARFFNLVGMRFRRGVIS